MNSTISDSFLQDMRQQTDPVADQVIHYLFSSGDVGAVNKFIASISKNNTDLPTDLPEQVIQFFEQTAYLPSWANRKQMSNGASFFAKHVQPILSILGSLSLPY